jgi:hypothetical protein
MLKVSITSEADIEPPTAKGKGKSNLGDEFVMEHGMWEKTGPKGTAGSL